METGSDEGAGYFRGVLSGSDTLSMKTERLESSEPQALPKTYVCVKGIQVAGVCLLLCKWHPASQLQANSDPRTMSSNCAHWTPICNKI